MKQKIKQEQKNFKNDRSLIKIRTILVLLILSKQRHIMMHPKLNWKNDGT